ncbi:cache domain-containing protein [Massilia sp. W12]|uniref:cache domain-containing protein n=1 Tax=Massilia sp. W12 TaxID=3126507 RepID=UPI0030D4156A
MMKWFWQLLLVLGLSGLASAMAQQNSTPEQAQAMVKKAIAFYQAHGREKTIAAVSDPAGPFNERDLYVVMYDLKGTVISHGANKKLIGKNIIDLKDADGVMIVKEQLAAGQGKNGGWVNYRWPHPVSKEMGKKSMYNEIVEDVMFACGIYR